MVSVTLFTWIRKIVRSFYGNQRISTSYKSITQDLTRQTFSAQYPPSVLNQESFTIQYKEKSLDASTPTKNHIFLLPHRTQERNQESMFGFEFMKPSEELHAE